MKRVDLTYDQGQERQARWRKFYAKDRDIDPGSIEDAELLNWLSMNFNVSRKVIKIEEI